MAMAIGIGIVGCYPYRCCCHHRCHSSCRRLCCLRCRCPDVSVAADAPAAPPLPAAAEATVEEEHDGCDGADPRRRLDDALLSLADGILLRSIVATTAGAAATAVRCTATATMSMPTIDVVTVDWTGGLGWRQRQQRRGRGQRQRRRESGRVRVRFLVGCPPPTLGGAFREEEDDNEDAGDEQGRRA